jgi:hypothetical protein
MFTTSSVIWKIEECGAGTMLLANNLATVYCYQLIRCYVYSLGYLMTLSVSRPYSVGH